MTYPSKQQARQLARGLGWFSIALGAVELLAGPALARGVGLPSRGTLVRGYGLREIVNGAGLLGTGQPAPWMWARVAGDVADLVTLAGGLGRGRAGAGNALALGAVAGVAALDLLVARRLSAGAAQGVDYSDRSGLPLPPDEMRGAARADFEPPEDLRTPAALRPWVVNG